MYTAHVAKLLFSLCSGTDNSLWVSGLTSSFRAADLKQMFSKFGKVSDDMLHNTSCDIVTCN